MAIISLDIGCGNIPKGDVNCDLYITDTEDHRGNTDKQKLNTKDIPNFVLCDALHLPFKTNSFVIVQSAQLIEHLSNPEQLIKEMARVSKSIIIIETYHKLGNKLHPEKQARKWFKEHHVSNMNFKWLTQTAQKYKCQRVTHYVKSYTALPHQYLPLFQIPAEIGIVLHKTQ